MPTDSHDTPDEGRSLWWMIPTAVAAVLGYAGATILRARQQHAGQAPVSTPIRDNPPTALSPLADDRADAPRRE